MKNLVVFTMFLGGFYSAQTTPTKGLKITRSDSVKDICLCCNKNPQLSNNIVFIINGKEFPKEDFERLNPHAIESIVVVKGATAIEKYGEKAKNGAIEMTTKKGFDIFKKPDEEPILAK